MVNWLNEKKIQDRLFDVAWILFLLSGLLSLTAWCPLDATGRMEHILLIIEYASAAVSFIVIVLNFICRKYPWKVIVGYGILAVIIAVSAYFANNRTMIVYFLIFGAAYGQNSRRVVTISAMLMGALMLVTIICSQVGLAPNTIWSRDGVKIREGLGFIYTSTGASMYLGFLLQYIYLRKEKLRIWEFLILGAVHVFFYLKTDSRMPFYLGIVIILFFFIESLFKNHWRFTNVIKPLAVAAPALIAAATVVSYLIYDRTVPFWLKINSLLSDRMNLGQDAIHTYGINLFGHDITWIGNGSGAAEGAYNYVDCSYIQELLTYGALFLIAVMALYVIAAIKGARIKDYWLVCVLIGACLYSVTEPNLIGMIFGPLVILAFTELEREPIEYKRGWLKLIFSR